GIALEHDVISTFVCLDVVLAGYSEVFEQLGKHRRRIACSRVVLGSEGQALDQHLLVDDEDFAVRFAGSTRFVGDEDVEGVLSTAHVLDRDGVSARPERSGSISLEADTIGLRRVVKAQVAWRPGWSDVPGTMVAVCSGAPRSRHGSSTAPQ